MPQRRLESSFPLLLFFLPHFRELSSVSKRERGRRVEKGGHWRRWKSIDTLISPFIDVTMQQEQGFQQKKFQRLDSNTRVCFVELYHRATHGIVANSHQQPTCIQNLSETESGENRYPQCTPAYQLAAASLLHASPEVADALIEKTAIRCEAIWGLPKLRGGIHIIHHHNIFAVKE